VLNDDDSINKSIVNDLVVNDGIDTNVGALVDGTNHQTLSNGCDTHMQHKAAVWQTVAVYNGWRAPLFISLTSPSSSLIIIVK
jgi:hypothetical protein